MSGPDDIVREALASLLEEHPRAAVTDPASVRALLEAKLGPTPQVEPELVDALVLATHTAVLRNLAEDARSDTTEAQLDTALRKLGVGGSAAGAAAALWSEALLPPYRLGAAGTGAPAVHTVASSPSPRPASPAPPVLPTPPRPPQLAPPPAPPAPPSAATPPSAPSAPPPMVASLRTGPDPRPARPRPAWLEAPTLPHETVDPPGPASADPPPADPPPADPPPADPPPADRPLAVAAAAAGVIGVPIEHHAAHGWPGRAKLAVGLLALVSVVVGAIAFVGWNHDPSKTRASSAESEVAQLTDDLATAKQATADANAATATAKATIGERDGQLATAKDQIAKMATVTRAQLNSARFPDTFTMSGKVAAGSCSLTGEACNVTATVRSIKITCATKPCDCTTGSCTVTSELWRTASPITFDASTNLFSAKGLLDGDVFRCAGVAQPTNFDFRFRVSKVNFDAGVWKVNGLDAELAESSSAVAECLAGNRTYALGGPTA